MSYSPTLGRFLQRDPLGYVDGGSLHEYLRGNPVANRDSTGYASAIGDFAEWLRNEAERRRGWGPWGDAAHHCWINCMVTSMSREVGALSVIVTNLRELQFTNGWFWDICGNTSGYFAGTSVAAGRMITCDDACFTAGAVPRPRGED